MEIGAFGHENKIYCKANKYCAELTDENTEFTKRLDFKSQKKKKKTILYVLVRWVHKNPAGACFIIATKYALQSKFLNLFPMFLSLYTPKLKIFIKMLNSHQLTTCYAFYEMLTPSFNN